MLIRRVSISIIKSACIAYTAYRTAPTTDLRLRKVSLQYSTVLYSKPARTSTPARTRLALLLPLLVRPLDSRTRTSTAIKDYKYDLSRGYLYLYYSR